MVASIIDRHVTKLHRAVAEFHENLLRSLLPHEMEVDEAAKYLKENSVQFLVFPDGRTELHGFGKKLGDVFCGVEPPASNDGIRFDE